MGGLLKNQRNLFVVLAGILLLSTFGWYFGYHKSFSASYYQTKNQIESLTRKKNSYIQKRNQIKKIEQEWGVLNDEFELVLNKIPSKMGYDRVSNALFNLLNQYNLSITNYSPSAVAIETKTITMPESDDKITIEKIPIDIAVKGTFVNFGRMLEKLGQIQFRVTVSDIAMDGENNNISQNIIFIAYAYFKSTGEDLNIELPNWEMPVNQNISDNASEKIGGIITMPWKGEEVIVGIDNPQYTSEGLEIYSIEYSDGRKEFVERGKLPYEIFNEPTTIQNDNTLTQNKQKQEVLQLKTQFSEQLDALELRVKSFKSLQDKQQEKYEQELAKAEEENKSKLDSMQKVFEKQLALQEEKISTFREQEKIKEELKKIDQTKAEMESKSKIESLRISFEAQLRQQEEKIVEFEALQFQQQEEMAKQKEEADRESRSKLEALQKEFAKQLSQQQQKIVAFEALQEKQKKEKQNQDQANLESQRKLQEMQLEFEAQLQQQQQKIVAFEALQAQRQQEMAEKKAQAKQASKEKLAEIQREFVNQLKRKGNQIADISSQITESEKKAPKEMQKPEMTTAEKKALQKKQMKEFITTLKTLEAQEKKEQKEKLALAGRVNRMIVGPIKRNSNPKLKRSMQGENLENVFENMSTDGVYRFGDTEPYSQLIIITTGPQVVAQLRTGYWAKPNVWEKTYLNLTNVKIVDEKLSSEEYSGEFIFYDEEDELTRGLRLEDFPKKQNVSVGKRISSIKTFFEGSYPYTSIRLLSRLELQSMPSRNELKLMRNEIFARYGYKFEPNGRMDKHFAEKPWYLPEHEDVTPFLTDIEVQNVNQIKSTEIEVLEAIQFLKSFSN